MTQRIETMLQDCLAYAHHKNRMPFAGAAHWQNAELSPVLRSAHRLKALLAAERPAELTGREILFVRTVTDVPGIFTEAEQAELKEKHFIHELGNLSNICPSYQSVMELGLDEVKVRVQQRLDRCRAENDGEGEEFLAALLMSIDAVYDLCGRYRAAAEQAGNTAAANRLAHVPYNPPRSFAEALQFFRILHYTCWAEGMYHVGIGRFDQYMWPYLQKDLESGVLTEESALELLEEFFLSFNMDSDMYPGVQQGDDGQSMMLGGRTGDGKDAFNLLSSLCLTASRELKVIDPKINLRVDKNTPIERYEEGTRLTMEGLGFPQYSNDDIVIPALIEMGYAPEDAVNYTVAACWEFIIPHKGMDIDNIAGVSFPKCIDKAMRESLADCANFDAFRAEVVKKIVARCDEIEQQVKGLYVYPSPFVSMMMDGCIDSARDVTLGCKYNNYGVHGTGVSTAADTMAAIRKIVFEEKSLTAGELIAAVDANFEGRESLRQRLRSEMPKMGNDDDYVDGEAVFLLDAFADALAGRTNERGGIFRAGTGSAMFYLQHAAETPATADGRSHGEPFGANYAPSLYAKTGGPVSIVRSFTKPNLARVCNGGPLTMEFDSTLFRSEESRSKVAQLVRYFIHSGGHQFQLNAVSAQQLHDAQQNPEQYRRLVVRIWGWSAYFVELDKSYQDHVIARRAYGL